MATRFYLRQTSTGLPSGTLPSAEQSTLVADANFEANDATNRRMTRNKGTGQTSLSKATLANNTQKIYYCARWVSDNLTQTSVAANTWTFGIAGTQNSTNANFPPNDTGNTEGMWVNAYIWKPSNGTKYGTILNAAITNNSLNNSNSEQGYVKTFSGSAVSSLTSGDAVIIVELWCRLTQATAASNTIAIQFDGVTTITDGGLVADAASYLETPENLSVNDGLVTTKLYLHNTTTGIPTGTLPTAEQSTKTVTSACNFEGSQTTNRLMNTTIGVSQTSLALATPASTSALVFYVSRWVSPVFQNTSIAAGTWTYNFAAQQSSTSANFPCTSNAKAVWVNCYVWKPSNGTKYGTILDGNTAATINEGASGTEASKEAEFTGSAVSSLTAGDACIVFEAWFDITQGNASSFTDTYYYDGTTETAGTGTTVSNHASLISYFGAAIDFSAGTTPVNQTYTHKYKIAQLATQTRTHKYKIVGRATASKTHKYKIRSLVNSLKTFKYKIVGRIARTLTHKYKIIGRATTTKTFKYKIIGRASRTYIHKYNILLLVSKLYTHKYKIRQLVAAVKTFKYKIIGRAAKTFTHLYKLRALTSQTYTQKYKIRSIASRIYTHIYKIVGRAARTYTHKYNIKVLVNKTFTHKYKIRLLVSVVKTFRYKIRQLATATKTFKYKIRMLVAATKTHKYRILILAARTFTHKYKIRKLVTQSFTHIYKIISEQLVAQRAFIHKYKIVGRTNQTYIQRYKIRMLVTISKTFRYKIRQLATTTKTFRYKIRQLVNQSYIQRYKLRQLVTSTKTFRYKIVGRVSQTFTHIYNILQNFTQVSREFTHKYKIRSLVSNEFTFIYNVAQATLRIPLYLQSTQRKIESGFNRFAQRSKFRESESYLRQLGNRAVRKYLIRSRRAG